MKSIHHIYFANSQNMSNTPSDSVDLVVTSPPYPMIGMWDVLFSKQNALINKALTDNKGLTAFELMHEHLDLIWNESWRVLKKGGFACINIGDATRTINGTFMLYPNHAKIISSMLKIGFNSLPEILWRKQTNAPNKFMGSGMLPAGAYVTLEHEHILIFRKGEKREFKKNSEKINRRNSSFFWEERNSWFSDIWTDLKGTFQNLSDDKVRKRSAAFPIEVPYRLINMFSVKGDTVLDPFLGTGTTTHAAIAACRNSIGYELEKGFEKLIFSGLENIVSSSNKRIDKRIETHLSFVEERIKKGKGFKHINQFYNFPVITKQETELILNKLISAKQFHKNQIEATYLDKAQCGFDNNINNGLNMLNDNLISQKSNKKFQLSLF